MDRNGLFEISFIIFTTALACRLQIIDDRRWLRTPGIVRMSFDVSDDPLAIGNEASGRRQLPGVIAVETRQIDTQFDVDGFQIFRQREGQPETRCHTVVEIHQNGKGQIMFFYNLF